MHQRFFETGEWCVFAAVLKFCAAQPHDGRSDPPSETLQLFGVCWAGGRRSQDVGSQSRHALWKGRWNCWSNMSNYLSKKQRSQTSPTKNSVENYAAQMFVLVLYSPKSVHGFHGSPDARFSDQPHWDHSSEMAGGVCQDHGMWWPLLQRWATIKWMKIDEGC